VIEIIDAHASFVFPGEPLPNDQSLWPTFESRLEVLREAGIKQALASRWECSDAHTYDELVRLNRRAVEVCKVADDVLIPAAIVDVALGERVCELLSYCRHELNMRFVGETGRTSAEWGTAAFWQMLDHAATIKMIPIVHCADKALAELGDRCTLGRILIAEFVRREEYQVNRLNPYPNLYPLFSGHRLVQAGAVLCEVRVLGAERVVFGSGLSGMDPVVAVECIRRSHLNDEDQALVFGGNFRALWQWTEA